MAEEPGYMVEERGYLVEKRGYRASYYSITPAETEALYPSLEAVEVANIVIRAVQESKVEFKGVDYMEACKYIALTST